MSQNDTTAFPVFWSHMGCPNNADDVAEAYWMGRLSTAEMLSFDSHCRACPECAKTSLDARCFVVALSNVVARVRPLAVPPARWGGPENSLTNRHRCCGG
jgi:hypothetical protein